MYKYFYILVFAFLFAILNSFSVDLVFVLQVFVHVVGKFRFF